MSVNGWRYYNHAVIPTTPPHENPDVSPLADGSIWHVGGTPLLARWTTEFDCGYETNWWYVIKDTPFDISALKSNRRYKITKGTKYFEVCRINPESYKEELYNVTVEAYKAYPQKYRPTVEHDDFIRNMENWDQYTVYGAFHRETNTLCGYVLLKEHENNIDLSVAKTIPSYERLQVNAALVNKILEDYQDFLVDGYICDGSRNISHETAYQDYLEYYFGFRKAYCKLHIVYNPKISWMIKLLFPFRKFLLKLDGIGIVHQINAVLKMEELCKSEVAQK